MSVLLSLSAFEQATIRLLDFGGLLRPTMGGPDQRLNRLGNRFGVDYEIGDVDSSSYEGRTLRQSLIRAKTQGALCLLPQDGLDTGTPGAPVIRGAGQTGTLIQLRGFTAGYAFVVGQPFSMIVGGRRYLHTSDFDGVADSSGNATLTISPMLRVSPPDGAVCEFQTPYIEGNITSDISWIYTPGNWQGQSVSIEEAA